MIFLDTIGDTLRENPEPVLNVIRRVITAPKNGLIVNLNLPKLGDNEEQSKKAITISTTVISILNYFENVKVIKKKYALVNRKTQKIEKFYKTLPVESLLKLDLADKDIVPVWEKIV